MSSNRLQLNADKTEVMWCTSTRRMSQLPSHPLSVAGTNVYSVSVVRDLGVFIAIDLRAATHVRRTGSHCFGALRQLRHLRRYVRDDCLRSLVMSLIHSRLDYGNFILVGLPAYLQRHLQSFTDIYLRCSTLRLVWSSGFAATTPSQMLSQRFTGCVCLNGLTSKSLWWRNYMVWHRHTWISWFVSPTFLVATVCAHLHSNCCTFRHTVLLLLAVARFRLLHPLFGTRYLQVPAVQSSATLSVFCQRLKTHLFHKSFPDLLL